MKFLCMKMKGVLVPVDDAGHEALAKVSGEDVVSVKIKKPRNPKLLRKYHALLDLVFKNQDRYPTRDHVDEALRLSCGAWHLIELPGGVQYKVPSSISYEDMEEIEFVQYLDRVYDAIARHYLPGITVETLRRQVEGFIGARIGG